MEDVLNSAVALSLEVGHNSKIDWTMWGNTSTCSGGMRTAGIWVVIAEGGSGAEEPLSDVGEMDVSVELSPRG